LPARRVWIPKPGSTERRPLSIPAVRDRVVQAAVKLVLEPVFEADFLPCSFGFRPKRGAHDTLQVLIDETWRGRRWIVETDIASCFEAIPHDKLMLAVEERVVDRRVLKLLRAMLHAGVMEDGTVTRTATGTPQGGVVSPLLANIYLHRVDRAWQTAGVGVLVRYADDRVPRTQGGVDVEGRTRRAVLCQR
jgi:group II intron reverse transcriptase/maturase